MSLDIYLESLPFHDIVRYSQGNPANAVAFIGVPRKHPYDPEKLMIFGDPLGASPVIVEFKVSDIIRAEQLPSPVTQEGESLFMVRVWVRRGALAMQYQPFEVADPPVFIKDSPELRKRFTEGISRPRE